MDSIGAFLLHAPFNPPSKTGFPQLRPTRATPPLQTESVQSSASPNQPKHRKPSVNNRRQEPSPHPPDLVRDSAQHIPLDARARRARGEEHVGHQVERQLLDFSRAREHVLLEGQQLCVQDCVWVRVRGCFEQVLGEFQGVCQGEVDAFAGEGGPVVSMSVLTQASGAFQGKSRTYIK